MQDEEKDLVKRIVQKTIEAEKQIRKTKILYNTRILMEQYREMHRHVEAAMSEAEDMKATEYSALLADDTAHLDSIRRTRTRTALMLANIDRAMEELRKEYDDKGILYKWEAFRLHYIEGLAYEEVADSLNCGKNTPSRWGKELLKKMSVKLFGVDGTERW